MVPDISIFGTNVPLLSRIANPLFLKENLTGFVYLKLLQQNIKPRIQQIETDNIVKFELK